MKYSVRDFDAMKSFTSNGMQRYDEGSKKRNKEGEYNGVKPEWRMEDNSCNEILFF